MAQGARSQLKSELGPEFADFDFESLNPRTFVRKNLLEDDDDIDPAPYRPAADRAPTRPAGQPSAQPGTSAATDVPPFDPDTT
jgi:sec-independent protein translocase protein TatB